jgi:glycine/sarcosine/betaine reductase complex component C subunit alpha
MAGNIENIIARTFLDIAHTLETGEAVGRPKIALTAMGSEHGEANAMAGAVLAQSRGVDVTFIGTLQDDRVNCVKVATDEECHATMEKMVESGAVDGAVTMHYPFPIGVATVGRVVTPGRGKAMYLATTTGTAATDRVEAMVKNAIYGIITAKACGISNPTIGIANIDGARQTEAALKSLQEHGYAINFSSSERADGGCVMRGNDVLTGAADIMVMDSLTGNLMMKLLSAFTTGGSYESLGWGYGPGIGEGYEPLVLIVSRASGAAVMAGALEFGAELVRGNYRAIAAAEFAAANKAGLKDIINARKAAAKPAAAASAEVKMPPKEVVTADISGVEIMELEDAVKALWAAGIYAESGMGCTGPIILVAPQNKDKAIAILKERGFSGE